MISDPHQQFADLVAEFKKVVLAIGSENAFTEEVARLITTFAEADEAQRLALIRGMKTLVDACQLQIAFKSETGRTPIGHLLEILNHPSDYTSHEVAIAESSIEELIAKFEAMLKAEIAGEGETDYSRELAETLKMLKSRV